MKLKLASPHPIRHWLAASLLLSGSALAADQMLNVKLSGDAEVPAVTTAAAGSGQITVAPDHAISGQIKVTGVAGTMAHIHEAAAGKNGPVAIPLTKSGDDTFVVPPGAKFTDAQYASFMAGNLYINVHSAAHPGGEVRAQLMPAMADKSTSSSGARGGY